MSDTPTNRPRLHTARHRRREGHPVRPAPSPVVLFFYPRDDTSGCTNENEAFSALLPEFNALGVKIYGISKDSIASHDKFMAKKDLTVPLLSDEDSDVCEKFGVWKEKSMYGKKFMGIERVDLPDRRSWRDRAELAQGEGAGPCRGGAGRGQGALTGRTIPEPAVAAGSGAFGQRRPVNCSYVCAPRPISGRARGEA